MKFKLVLPTVTWLAFIAAPPAVAQQPAVWTLANSVQRALEVAPELRAANAEIAARAGGVTQAAAWPNPTVELRADEKSGIQNGRGGYRINQLSITQPIPISRLNHQRRAAEAELESARAQQRYQRLQIETRTAQAFHGLQRAAERQRLAQERLDFAEALQGKGDKNKDHLVRYLAPLEQARLAVLRETAQQAVAEAEGNWSEAAAQFRALLALAPEQLPETVQLTAAATPPALNGLIEHLPSHPALQATQHTLDASRAAVDAARAQRLADPTLSVFHERDELAGEQRNYSGLMLGVQIPLWSRNDGAVAQAVAATGKAEAQLMAQRRDLESRLRQNRLHLGHLIEQAEHYRTRLLTPSRRVLELTRKGFSSGEQSGLALVDANDSYFAAQAHYLDLMHDAWVEAAELWLAAGVSMLNQDNPSVRHSGAGRNPAKINSPRSGQDHDVAPHSREISNQLDSGLRRNDAILETQP